MDGGHFDKAASPKWQLHLLKWDKSSAVSARIMRPNDGNAVMITRA
jgi:hypothetical protein